MRNRNLILLAAAIALLISCGQADTNPTPTKQKPPDIQTTNTDTTPTSSSEVEQPATAGTVPPPPEEVAMLKRGKIVFLRCRSCHTLKENAPHLTGPNLHDLMGATVGKKEGYKFSDPMAASDLVWNAETLNEWLLSPAGFIPGNRMVFAGLPKEKDRAALIAYLAEETN